MRKIICNIFLIMLLFICSVLLVSCDAVTAQNIKHSSSIPIMNNGFGGMKDGLNNGGNPMQNGGVDTNRKSKNNQRMNSNNNANLIGKIISVDGNSIKIELAEQIQNNKGLNSNNGERDVTDNPNNNKMQPPMGFSKGRSEINYTGNEKILTISDEVEISEEPGMSEKNNTSKSTLKITDLQKDQVIKVWYKENTEIVERISVVQI